MEVLNRTYKKLTIVLYIIGEFFFYPLFASSATTVDYYTFQSQIEGKSRLEFYFSIDNSMMQFIADGDSFTATIPSSLYLFNSKNQVVKNQFIDFSFSCATFKETLGSAINHIFKFNIDLEPGDYRAVLEIDDKNRSGPVKLERHLSIPDYWNSFSLSSLQMFTEERKNINVPNLTHVSCYRNPKIEIYYEGYNFNNQNLTIKYLLKNELGDLQQKSKQATSVTNNPSGFKSSFTIAPLPSGKYVLYVEQVSGNDVASTKLAFTVVQSPINLVFRSYKKVVEELRFIATKEEIELLGNLPLGKRQEAINSFWEKYDPTVGTDKNEIMIEYYSRIELANKYFCKQERSGFETDFGMVFMLFGKPDRIMGSKQQRQIWFYKNLGLKFTFVSNSVFTAFNLVDKGQVFADYMPH